MGPNIWPQGRKSNTHQISTHAGFEVNWTKTFWDNARNPLFQQTYRHWPMLCPHPTSLAGTTNSKKKHKQRVLMHRHQGWNVRHGLGHIYMRYLYIYELFIAFVCFVVCSLLYRDGICGVLCGKWQARESTGMFGNLMAIYYIMPQFIQNHSRFVMLMKTCMIS